MLLNLNDLSPSINAGISTGFGSISNHTLGSSFDAFSWIQVLLFAAVFPLACFWLKPSFPSKLWILLKTACICNALAVLATHPILVLFSSNTVTVSALLMSLSLSLMTITLNGAARYGYFRIPYLFTCRLSISLNILSLVISVSLLLSSSSLAYQLLPTFLHLIAAVIVLLGVTRTIYRSYSLSRIAGLVRLILAQVVVVVLFGLYLQGISSNIFLFITSCIIYLLIVFPISLLTRPEDN